VIPGTGMTAGMTADGGAGSGVVTIQDLHLRQVGRAMHDLHTLCRLATKPPVPVAQVCCTPSERGTHLGTGRSERRTCYLFMTPGGDRGAPALVWWGLMRSFVRTHLRFVTCSPYASKLSPASKLKQPIPPTPKDTAKPQVQILMNPPARSCVTVLTWWLGRLMYVQVRPWLDLIDALRADGVQQDLPLPQIAVMGESARGTPE
jgi:hypothetical protein